MAAVVEVTKTQETVKLGPQFPPTPADEPTASAKSLGAPSDATPFKAAAAADGTINTFADDSKLPNPTVPPPSDIRPMRMIYNEMNKLYGQGMNDVFQLEFPCRLLEMNNYMYEGSDTINAQQVKPPPVVEAEFRLSNDMYDVSCIVGGPNGNKLSERYHEALFSMVSANATNKSPSELALKQDQEKICAWLEEEIADFDPPAEDLLDSLPEDLLKNLRSKPAPKMKQKKKASDEKADGPAAAGADSKRKIPRVDLYQKLLDVYNSERFRWVTFKDTARPKDFKKQDEVNAYDRLLMTYAPLIDAKLEALWTVLLVRGDYHKVRRYIGYVDIESASESLQRAKENLRASVFRSIDDTEDIYPVVLTPANWAKYLTTNFKPEDLLNDVSIVRNQLFDAEKSRTLLLRRQNALVAGQKDIGKLQTALDVANDEYRAARTAMIAGYSDAVFKTVELYFGAVSRGASNPAKIISKISPKTGLSELQGALGAVGLNQPLLDEAEFTRLQNAQVGCLEKQAAQERASEAANRARQELAEARGNDSSNLIFVLDQQIQSLTIDIEYYKKVLGAAENPFGTPISRPPEAGGQPPNETPKTGADGQPPKETPKTGADGSVAVPVPVPTAPELPKPTDAASVWQEVVITYNHSASAKASFSTSSVKREDWDSGFWFWSHHNSSESSNSESSHKYSTSNTDVKVAFRVMKVGIQRPWMDAGILAKTRDFYRASETKISKMFPVNRKEKIETSLGSEDELLPSFPTGFVVAKDIHIILSSTETFDSSFVSQMRESSNSGGGFLCFGGSKSSSSSDNRESAVVTSDGQHLSIKIAAPQILGWICELTPQDLSVRNYNALPDDEFVTKQKAAGGLSAESFQSRPPIPEPVREKPF